MIYLEDLFDVHWPNALHRTPRNQTVQSWEATDRPPSGKWPGEGEVIGTSRTHWPHCSLSILHAWGDAEGGGFRWSMSFVACRIEISVGARVKSLVDNRAYQPA
jgi:hypothetical protein